MRIFLQKMQQKLQEKDSPLSTYTLITLAFAIIIAMFMMTIHYQMHVTTQESLHLYLAKYAAAAISSIEHHLNGFVGFNNIYNVIYSHGTIDDNILNEAVAVTDFASGGVYKIVGMELGYCIFAKSAFLLFGYHVKSFLYLYFLVLVISVIAYILEFKESKPALALLVIFTLSFYLIALKSVDMPLNVGVIYGYRFMPLLAILPLLHIFLFVFTGKSLGNKNIFSAVLLIIQSALIIWMYHIRLSTQWMFISIFSLLFINLFFIWRKSSSAKIKIFMQISLPIVLFFFVLFVSKIMMLYASNDVYKQQGEGAHVFWHSIYAGLALHPEIRKEYTNERPPEPGSSDSWNERSRYVPRDQDALSASFKWLYKTGRNEYAVFNFQQADHVKYCAAFTFFGGSFDGAGECGLPGTGDLRAFDWEKDFNWGAHDKVVRDIVFDVVKKHPLEVLEVIFIIKPLKTMHMYLESFVKIQDYFRLRSIAKSIPALLSLLVILFSLAFLLKNTEFNLISLVTPMAMMFLFSLIIPLAVYPELWTIADSALLLTVIVYLLIVGFFRLVLKRFDTCPSAAGSPDA